MSFGSSFKFLLPLILIPLILVVIWFRNGLITGGGEEGILFYYPKKTLELSNSVWVEYGTGGSAVGWLSKAPIIYLATLFDKFGLPLFIFQLTLFYTLMVIGVLSVYFLTINLVDEYKSKNIVSLISAIFYLFNPYTFSQIWGRSLYTQYFAFSLLPLSLLLFYLGMRRKKYIFGFFIAITSVPLAAAYGFSTFIVVYWLVLLFYFIFRVLTSKDRKKEIIFGIKFSFFTFILWCLFNSWWFISLLSSFGNFYSGYISGVEENLGTLLGVSRSYSLDVIVRLLHRGYFFDASAYSQIYSTLPFQIISFIPLCFVLIGLIKILRNKELIKFRFFVVLLILGLVISLGANPPFGWLFVWFFKNVTPLQAFRNPFEKFGLVLVLGYSVIFAYGLVASLEKSKLKNLILLLVVVLTCGIYAWPMWTGRVIAGSDKKIGLDIPSYYKDLRQWLKNQESNYRLLMTPIWAGDGAFYRWNDAARYQGIDPMVFMLDQPTISSTSRAPFYFEFISSVRKYMERENVAPAVSSFFRAKFLIDRKDAIFITDRERAHYKFLTSTIYPPKGAGSDLRTICKNEVAYSGLNNLAWINCQIPQGEGDLSDIKYLHVKVKTSESANLEVAIRDSKETRIRWDGRRDLEYSTNTNDWRYITIPLSSPTEYNSAIDLSQVFILEVLAHPKGKPLESVKEINLGEVKLDPGIQRQTNEFKEVAQFGNLAVFESNHFNPAPEFGTLSQVEKVKDFLELFDLANRKRELTNLNGFLVSSQNSDKDLDKLLNRETVPVIDKQKITNTRYWLKIEGEGKDSLIILSKTFNPQWKVIAGVSKEELSGNFFDDIKLLQKIVVAEENHFVVNGYANLWKINGPPAGRAGKDSEYAIVFIPQIIADIGFKISIFSILIMSGFIVIYGLFFTRARSFLNRI